MSKQAGRAVGQKRKHDEMSSMPSPAPGTPQQSWNGALPAQYNPAQYQNNYYNMGHFDPQAAYAMQAHQAAIAQAASNIAAASAASAHRGQPSSVDDRPNVNQLKDAMSMGGVSLREEEEYAHGNRVIPTSYHGQDRSLKQDFLPEHVLIDCWKSVAKRFNLAGIEPAVIALTGLAVEQRVRSLIEKINSASQHRWETQTAFSSGIIANAKKEEGDDEGDGERVATYADGKTPVFDRSIRRDVSKQLMAIEKIERAEEMRIRRERKERQELQKQSMGGGKDDLSDEEDGPPKKRKKRAEGPGVQAKNMSEETKKKLSNTVANAAAGFGSRYAWMNTASTPIPRRPNAGGGATGGAGGGGAASANAGNGWTGVRKKQKVKERSLSMRDVLFVVEREKGHGAGRGSARGWN